MPVSHHEGKEWSAARIKRACPLSVVDVGAGEGIYSMLMRFLTPPNTTWAAIEAFEPYVERFNLWDKYDEVVVADVRDLMLSQADLYIFGDVLEHMPKEDAKALLRSAQRVANAILVSLPIVHIEQGAVNDNEYEVHHAHWGFEEMHEFLNPLHSMQGEVLGVFWWEK